MTPAEINFDGLLLNVKLAYENLFGYGATRKFRCNQTRTAFSRTVMCKLNNDMRIRIFIPILMILIIACEKEKDTGFVSAEPLFFKINIDDVVYNYEISEHSADSTKAIIGFAASYGNDTNGVVTDVGIVSGITTTTNNEIIKFSIQLDSDDKALANLIGRPKEEIQDGFIKYYNNRFYNKDNISYDFVYFKFQKTDSLHYSNFYDRKLPFQCEITNATKYFSEIQNETYLKLVFILVDI